MLEVSMNSVFSLSSDIFLYQLKELGKYWVFNVDTGEHYTLNETSFWILEQIDGMTPLKEVLARFLKAFDVGAAKGKKDFSEVVKGFVNESIIKKRRGKTCQTKKGKSTKSRY